MARKTIIMSNRWFKYILPGRNFSQKVNSKYVVNGSGYHAIGTLNIEIDEKLRSFEGVVYGKIEVTEK